MLKLRNHFRLVLLVYWFISLHTCCCLAHTSIATSRHLLMIAVTVRVNNLCPAFLKLVAIYSWFPNNVYVLNGAVPINVKRMCLIFKISKINLEYVAIFLTEIPQCLQRGRREQFWGISCEKLPFYSKKSYFSNCGGRRENVWSILCEKSRFHAKKSYFFQF
jgi:hypothetical protein